MHSNPFSATGYDISDLRRRVDQKADSHELHSRDSRLDSLERTVRELSSENASLCSRIALLEESCRELLEAYRADNSQFGVGA